MRPLSLRGNPAPTFSDRYVEPVAPPLPRRPRLGLALGGGAARGWAHLGVIEALEDAGIVPDIVVGCSIGAVIGGCYAAGKLGALEDFARSLTRRRVVGLLDLRFPGPGLIAGDRLRARLVSELSGRRIEQLPITFACVATELGTGHEVWLANGPLVDALRASYAIPGLFPPVAIDDRLLMDGTLVNPVPVRLARDLGADVVVCVNLNCDPRVRGSVIRPQALLGRDAAGGNVDIALDEAAQAEVDAVSRSPSGGHWDRLRKAGMRLVGAGREERVAQPALPGLARVMFDAFNITQDRISRARLATDPPDLAITPNLSAMGQFEFHRAEEAITVGRSAARAALPALRAMIAGAAARA